MSMMHAKLWAWPPSSSGDCSTLTSVFADARSVPGMGMNEWMPTQLPMASPSGARQRYVGSVGSETSSVTAPTRP